MKTILRTSFALLLSVNFLFAQEQKEANHQFFYSITVEASDASKSYKKKLQHKEAIDFDVLAFLEEQEQDTRVKIYGRKVNNADYITYSFDSKNIKGDGDCVKFCEKIESIERVPFLGVAVIPMDDFSGVEVDYLLENSPLNETGIQPGDIITSVDIEEVTDPCNLIAAVKDQDIDATVDIHFIRNDESHFINSKIGYRLKKKVTWANCCDLDLDLQQTSEMLSPKDRMTLNVFPNPTSGLAQFEFSTPNLSETEIKLSDFNGRVITSKKVLPLNGVWNDYLDLSSFAPGVYVLQIKQQEQVITERVVVMKD